ncbi:MAG: amidase [Candidatus Bathyarchaeota archaeon]|nr:amidase [Candidatus Bathyarchaeota archaeon]
MPEPHRLTVSEAAKRIKEGQLTPLDLLESLLARIEELEPRLDAWVTVDAEGARKAAKTLTREATGGKLRSPLHGIPVGIKDIYDTKGLRTTMGSPIFADHVPGKDAAVVTKLREAGAVIIGKTETTEFAYLDPAPTRNPWNTGHTPGGSSSGSAAAVAARMCPLAFGTQTGGSVMRPASFCGVAAIKPTHDLLSREGIYPQSWSLDHAGFMARSVEDLKLALGALTGVETRSRIRKPRIGLPTTYFNEAGTEEVTKNYEEAAARLRGAGAEIIDYKLPDIFPVIHSAHRVIMFSEAAAVHEAKFRESPGLYRPHMQAEICSGLLIPSSTYLHAQRIRGKFKAELTASMGGLDALLTPTALTPALKGLASTGDAAFNAPWSLAGFPTVTIPSGLTGDGLPLGIQLIAKPYEEAKLLGVAAWCESALPFDAEPPLQ